MVFNDKFLGEWGSAVMLPRTKAIATPNGLISNYDKAGRRYSLITVQKEPLVESCFVASRGGISNKVGRSQY